VPKGYSGKILRINLTDGEVTVEKPDDLFYRRYLGGWGFIGYYLLKELKPGTDPLGPDNKLIFAPGIFSGVALSGNSRIAIGAKSPLTGGFGAGEAGGYFAAELTNAGWDAIIVDGRAADPSYISIVDDKVEVKDASGVWGKDIIETQDILTEQLGVKNTRFALIGQAGENQVLVSAIGNDDNHFAGRAGLGAVMGAKNLKAIAVKASGRKEVDDRDKIREVTQWLLGDGKTRYQGMQDYGTDGGLMDLNAGGGLPTRNFKFGQIEGAENVSGQTMAETILVNRPTCYACVIRCKRAVEITEGPFKADPRFGGPEYETVGSVGTNCGIADLAAIAAGNQVCNATGLDTIGAGMMVSFAMECFENGLITEEDTGGLKLNFGNCEGMVKLLEMIANREGIGDLLAGGYKPCIAKWGPKAEEYAIHSKWQPFPMHEPRFKFALGLGYAVSPTGADHMHNLHDTMVETEAGLGGVAPYGVLEPLPATDLSPAKVRILYYQTLSATFKNMIGVCAFPPFNPNVTVDLVRAITGWETSLFELAKAAERAWTMARAFNTLEGFTPRDDTIPDRFYEAFTSGPLEGVSHDTEQFQQALNTYYQIAGWDPVSGAPTAAKCAELDVGWLADLLRERELTR